jgi:hypothetical protein
MPHSGGYIVWVHNAIGPALALLNGMVNLLCNVFDCALYPLLLAHPHLVHGHLVQAAPSRAPTSRQWQRQRQH